MKIVIVGDFYPNSRLDEAARTFSPEQIFGEFYGILQEADLSIVNLECPLTEASKPISKTGPALKADHQFAGFLKSSGFNLVTLANNHILDFGQIGLADTIHAFKSKGLNFTGVGFTESEAAIPYYFTDIGGETLAVINCAEQEWSIADGSSGGAAMLDPIKVYNTIQEAKSNADYILIITHGGHENYNLPTRRFKRMMRFFVDAGADAVINHHPHTLSGSEIYKGKPIYYSLGNFLFGNNSEELTYWNEGLAVELVLTRQKLSANHYFFHQSCKDNIFKLLEGEDAESLKYKFNSLSNTIAYDDELDKHFIYWCKQSEMYYKINIEPHSYRVLQAIQNRGWLPSLWSKRKKLFLLNMLRCESHRELLSKNLEREVSNT